MQDFLLVFEGRIKIQTAIKYGTLKNEYENMIFISKRKSNFDLCSQS